MVLAIPPATVAVLPAEARARGAHRDGAAAGAAARGAGKAALAAAAAISAATALGWRTEAAPRCEEHLLPSTLEQASTNIVVKSQRHLTRPTASNPTPTQLPPPIAGLSGHHLRQRLVTSILGLPLRGKAHMARRLKRYLEFFHGFQVKLFDVNEYLGKDGDDRLLEDLRAFFECRDAKQVGLQQKHVNSGLFAILFVTDTVKGLPSMWSGHSKWRRRWMAGTLEEELQAHIIFVEIQVDDSKAHRQEYMDRLERSRGLPPGALAQNIHAYAQHYVTIQNDGTEDDLAYLKLINYHHKVVTNNMMRSFIGSRVAQFLTSVHPYKRTIYLSRHGESEYNVEKKIGGDSSLSPLGREYAPRLAEFADLVICGHAERFECVTLGAAELANLRTNLSRVPSSGQTGGIFATAGLSDSVTEGMRLMRMQLGYGAPFQDVAHSVDEVSRLANSGPTPVTLIFIDDRSRRNDWSSSEEPPRQVCARLWTSSLRRTKETAAYIRHPMIELPGGKTWEQMAPRVYRNLDEVYAGDFEGFTYEEIKKHAPEEASLRKIDKLGYRYPRGESYYDIIARLDLPVQQLETFHEPTLIIGHQAVHRLLYAFLANIDRARATELDIPLHTVIKIEYDGTGAMQETRFFLGPLRLSDDGQQNL